MTRPSSILALLLACLAHLPSAEAHDDLSSEIRRLNASIASTPGNAELYLRRGEMNRLAENWAAAFADYQLAERLDPSLAGIRLWRARAAFQTKRYDLAKHELNLFLRQRPCDPAGFALRARVFAALGKWREAGRDFSLAVNRSRDPDPDDYLEWSRTFSSSGDDARAVRVLDAGLRRLGPIIALALPALELEEKLGRIDAALLRLDGIAATAHRPESWLARRGAILERAGRAGEARGAYGQALAALAALPDSRRNTRATSALEAQVKSAAARLDEDDPK